MKWFLMSDPLLSVARFFAMLGWVVTDSPLVTRFFCYAGLSASSESFANFVRRVVSVG